MTETYEMALARAIKSEGSVQLIGVALQVGKGPLQGHAAFICCTGCFFPGQTGCPGECRRDTVWVRDEDLVDQILTGDRDDEDRELTTFTIVRSADLVVERCVSIPADRLAAIAKATESSDPTRDEPPSVKRVVALTRRGARRIDAAVETSVRQGVTEAYRAGYAAGEGGDKGDEVVVVESIINDIGGAIKKAVDAVLDAVEDAVDDAWGDLVDWWDDWMRDLRDWRRQWPSW